MPERALRMAETLQKVIGSILAKEEFPDGSLVTITRVEVTEDLQQAKVYISVIPDGETPTVFRILQKRVFLVQQELNRAMRVRPVPKILWRQDRGSGNTKRVEELLEQIQKERNNERK